MPRSAFTEVRERGIFDGAYVAVTCIVTEDVEATESFDRRVDVILGLRFIRDVERYSPYTRSELTTDIDELLRMAERGHDAVSSLQSLFCERSAQTAGSSGN